MSEDPKYVYLDCFTFVWLVALESPNIYIGHHSFINCIMAVDMSSAEINGNIGGESIGSGIYNKGYCIFLLVNCMLTSFRSVKFVMIVGMYVYRHAFIFGEPELNIYQNTGFSAVSCSLVRVLEDSLTWHALRCLLQCLA